jgi:cell wall-associated NlpC family hydrolase
MKGQAMTAAALGILLAAATTGPAAGQPDADARATTAAMQGAGDTDFLSDSDFRRLPREERRRRWRTSHTSRLEPSGKPSADRIPVYLERYGELNILDPRLTVFQVRGEVIPGTTGTVKLSGEVLLPQHRTGAESTLRDLGFEVVENAIRTLPDLPAGTKPFGISTTTAATLRKSPRLRAEQVNSVPMGGWMRLLREASEADLGQGRPVEGKWFLAQSPEGYVGHVPESHFAAAADFEPPDGILLAPVAVRHQDAMVTVPLGALLKRGARGYSVPGLALALPQGAEVAGVGESGMTESQVMEAAKPLMDTDYEWGGTTERGIDCSGFTQFVYRTRGVFLPRDAEEQAIVGQIVAFGREVLTKARPGDLVFFLNDRGKVNHVAISLGGNRVIHSNGRNGVHVGTLEESEDPLDRSLLDRVIWVRRVLHK